MDLGEMLEVISENIEEAAAAEFERSGLPITMQPFVMNAVAGRFREKAHKHAIRNGRKPGTERSEGKEG